MSNNELHIIEFRNSIVEQRHNDDWFIESCPPFRSRKAAEDYLTLYFKGDWEYKISKYIRIEHGEPALAEPSAAVRSEDDKGVK